MTDWNKIWNNAAITTIVCFIAGGTILGLYAIIGFYIEIFCAEQAITGANIGFQFLIAGLLMKIIIDKK